MIRSTIRGVVAATALAYAFGAPASEAQLVQDGPWTSTNMAITWEFQPGHLSISEAHEGFEIVYEATYSVSAEDNTITYEITDVERRAEDGMTEEAPNLEQLVGQTFTVIYSIDTSVGTLNLNGEVFRN